MKRCGMVIDLKRCVGCYSCMIACKSENGTPPEIFFSRVVEEEIGVYPHTSRKFLPLLCNHCQDAPCERICPTGATYRREDGIVMVDASKCIGCRSCYITCPYKNRYYLSPKAVQSGYYGTSLVPYEVEKYRDFGKAGIVVKCTMCAHRVDQGLEPACVATCPARARIFGDLDDPRSEVSQLIARRYGTPMHPEFGTKPSVYYLD